MVWSGAAVTLLGLGGLIWCIASVARARRAGLSEEALRARLQRIIARNLAALFVAAIGLMLVVMGIALG